jgi:hypothetical protein
LTACVTEKITFKSGTPWVKGGGTNIELVLDQWISIGHAAAGEER